MANDPLPHPLKKWRVSNQLTLDAAARQVGTSRQVWFAWESGRNRPSPKFMAKLRTLTGGAVTADAFFCGLDDAA